MSKEALGPADARIDAFDPWVTCPECGGYGEEYQPNPDVRQACWRCEGSARVGRLRRSTAINNEAAEWRETDDPPSDYYDDPTQGES